jgi:hypothetical protein
VIIAMCGSSSLRVDFDLPHENGAAFHPGNFAAASGTKSDFKSDSILSITLSTGTSVIRNLLLPPPP